MEQRQDEPALGMPRRDEPASGVPVDLAGARQMVERWNATERRRSSEQALAECTAYVAEWNARGAARQAQIQALLHQLSAILGEEERLAQSQTREQKALLARIFAAGAASGADGSSLAAPEPSLWDQ